MQGALFEGEAPVNGGKRARGRYGEHRRMIKYGGVSTQAQDAAAFDLLRTEAEEKDAFMKPHVIPASSDARLGV